ncbi:MAG: GNAT family N-acetyltransferase [Variovorax sp.]
MTPTSTLHIRPCALEPGEAAVLAGIWRRAWASAHRDIATLAPIGHWLERVQAEFRAPGELMVVERENQLLAFMLMHPARRYVAQLFVDTHLQSQGMGGLLLDEADQRMPEGWRLHVATDNPAAQRFYMRCGLVRGPIDRHPGTGRERIEYHRRHE